MDSTSSSTNRWSEDGATKPRVPGSDVLGEALCRSQTRAREAERKAQRAYEERERLLRMFFKEAALACTYRQWVLSLQTENMGLRVRSQHERGPAAWLHQSVFSLNPFSALKRLSYRHWKCFGPDFLTRGHVQFSDHHQPSCPMWDGSGKYKHLVYVKDPDDIMMGYTVAFALGLSLAGAGLLVGWRMGWILLVY